MINNEIVEKLSKSLLFRGISKEILEEYLPLISGNIKEYTADSIVINQYEYNSSIFIVMEGAFSISRLSVDGHASLISKIDLYECIGIDVVFTDKKTSPYIVECKCKGSLYSFDYKCIKESGILPDSLRTVIMNNALYLLANQNIKRQHKIDILSRKDLRYRIITYLSVQEKNNKSKSFYIPFTREEMADFLCVNRSALSHELGLLKKEGLINFRKNYFEILY